MYNSFNLGLYSYSYQNPVKYLDPDGNAPNQAGATNPSVILNELRGYERNGLSQSDALQALADAHANNTNRYFYTQMYGWIDVRHFGRAASLANAFNNSGVIEALGVANEIVQWGTEWGDEYRSGFSPEDIPSNAAGARFGQAIKRNRSLGDQFERWLNLVGARDITDPASGFSSLPRTDPAARGGANRGSSNASSRGPGALRSSSSNSSQSNSRSSSSRSSSSSSSSRSSSHGSESQQRSERSP